MSCARWAIVVRLFWPLGLVGLPSPDPAFAQGRYQPQGAAERLFEEGLSSWREGDGLRAKGDEVAALAAYEAAASAFESAIAADPDYIDAYLKLGLMAYTLGQERASERAIVLLERAAARLPAELALQFWLGNNLMRVGLGAAALAPLQRAATETDAFPEANLVLGTFHYKADAFDHALPFLERYALSRPKDVGARGTLGNAYFKLERYQQAIIEFEAVRKDSPDNIQVLSNLGTCHHQLGDYARAVVLLEEALVKEPDRESVVFNLAQSYFKWGKYEPAIKHLRTVVALKPQGFNGHYFLGSALLEAGRSTEALAPLTEALRLKPTVAIAAYKMGLIHLRSGALAQAEQALEQASSNAPKDPWIKHAQGTVARRRNKLDVALALHLAAVEAAPDKARLHAGLAVTLHLMGKTSEAETSASRALTLVPSGSVADSEALSYVVEVAALVLTASAKVLLENDQLQEGTTRLERVVELTGGTPDALSNLALALMAQGKVDAALALSARALLAAPQASAVQRAHARVLLAKGAFAEARPLAERALSNAETASSTGVETSAMVGLAAGAQLLGGDGQAAVKTLEQSRKTVGDERRLARLRATAHLAVAATAMRTPEGEGAAESLKAALRDDSALEPLLRARLNYLSLIAALRRGDAASANVHLSRVGDAKALALALGASPTAGHLEVLTALTHLLSRREDKAVTALSELRGARKTGSPEARILRRAYERLADRAFQAGAYVDALKALRGASALGRDPVVDHNLLVLDQRGVKKLRAGAQFRSLTGSVNEAWFNLGVVLEAQGRQGEAYAAFVRYDELGGPYAVRARELIETKTRIFGFNR